MEANYPLRVKLIMSLLSGKPLKVKNIREDDPEPGLKGSNLCFDLSSKSP